VSGIPEDLATVVHAWDTLPEVIKAGIVAMVNAARRQWTCVSLHYGANSGLQRDSICYTRRRDNCTAGA